MLDADQRRLTTARPVIDCSISTIRCNWLSSRYERAGAIKLIWAMISERSSAEPTLVLASMVVKIRSGKKEKSEK